jgi:hypothetical protein
MFESVQAKILGLTAALALLMSFISSVVSDGAIAAILSFGMSILMLLLIIFDTNCVVIGGCNVWGWIKFAFSELFLVIGIVVAIVALASKKKKDPVVATPAAAPAADTKTADATKPTTTTTPPAAK